MPSEETYAPSNVAESQAAGMGPGDDSLAAAAAPFTDRGAIWFVKPDDTLWVIASWAEPDVTSALAAGLKASFAA